MEEKQLGSVETVADGPAASQSSETLGWYILDENSQHLGPYDVPTMEGIVLVSSFHSILSVDSL